MKHTGFSTGGLTAEAEFFRSSCFFGSGNNVQTRTRRAVSSILPWSSEFFLSFLVLEIFFFQNKKETCFQLPKPYTSYVHFVHSLKQRSIRWSKKHNSSGKKVKQCIPLNVRSWSRSSLSFHEFRATSRVSHLRTRALYPINFEGKNKRLFADLRWLEHPGTFSSICFFIVRLSRSCKVNKTERKSSIKFYLHTVHIGDAFIEEL